MANSKTNSNKKNGPAIGKRAKIDKAQRNMLIVVAIASVVLGITLVLVVYFAKTMSFNAKLIGVNGEVINVYKQTQTSLETISNEVTDLASNEYFESVARQRSEDCAVFDESGEDNAKTEFSLEEIETARECSALRVITDALPSVMNKETAMTSFIILLELPSDGSSVDSASGGELGSATVGDVTLNTIDMAVSFDDSDEGKIFRSLESIEKSIRNFDIKAASITFRGSEGLELGTTYATYYSGDSTLQYIKRTVCADKENEKCIKAGGDDSIVDMAVSEN
ncbi:MAG: hypothetical protein MJ155_00330 [Candidatus Saccharibacteria bacterium]|nr:hypothetical protein [Candidatus Saccharibacteria bacterium]